MATPNIDNNAAVRSLMVPFSPLPDTQKAKETEGHQLIVNDIKLDSEMMLHSDAEIPRLAYPQTAPDYAYVMGQLNTPELSVKLETLDALAIFHSLTPERAMGTVRSVVQREIVTATKTEDRVRAEGLINDDEELLYLAATVQVMLGGSLNNQIKASHQEQVAINDKVDSRDNVKELDFIGIQTDETMQFLLTMLRKIMAEINVAERRINAMFSELYASASELTAKATITEGERLLRGALISSSIAFAITGASAGVQARGLHKQNNLVKNELTQANKQKDLVIDLKEKGPDFNNSKIQEILRGNDGQKLTPQSLTPKAEKKIDALHQLSINKVEHRGNVLGNEYDYKTNNARTKNSIAESVGRNSDQAANVANMANMTSVKEAEAERTIQNTAAEVSKSVSNDKEKQIEKAQDMFKQMREILNQQRDSTFRMMQALVKG
ncbi:hypothetical protein [Enterobacter ludwigii]|jgi:type III secretion target IpaC/SipC family protein